MGKPESEYRYTAYEIFKITQAGINREHREADKPNWHRDVDAELDYYVGYSNYDYSFKSRKFAKELLKRWLDGKLALDEMTARITESLRGGEAVTGVYAPAPR